MQLVQVAIFDHLTNPTSGSTTDTVRQHARAYVRDHLGRNIFSGRAPSTAGSPACTMRQLTGGQEYHLAGQENLADPIIELAVMSRDPDAFECVLVADALRRVFTGYRGILGELFCHGCTMERGVQEIPARWVDNSDDWHHVASLDLRFTVNVLVPEEANL